MADDGWGDSPDIVNNGVDDQSVDGGNESGGEGDEGRGPRRENDGKCRNCREEGHIAAECPLPQVCRRCKEEGHKVSECPKPMLCNRCGAEGHMRRDCTEELQTRSYVDAEGNTKEIYVPKANEDADELYKMSIKTGINFGKYQKIPVKVTGENVPDGITSFANSGLRQLVLDNISKSEYSVPTPVQCRAIPIIKAGRDLMACAQTGSGKSAAFLVPIIDSLLEQNVESNASDSREAIKPECIVITPTRELARQIHRQAKKFAQGSVLRAVVAYGETSVVHQIEECRKGCNILVATPGRLLHFAEGNVISFANVKSLVLDEADRMLAEGFMDSVQKVCTTADMPASGVRQTLMFSATFSDEVQESAQDFLDSSYLFLTVGTVGAGMAGGICGDIDLNFLEVEVSDKREKLDALFSEMDKDNLEKTIIFVGKKTSADYLSAYLSGESWSTTSIHGDRTQRQREEALDDFTMGKYKILVATAVAARGLDIPYVQHVINYDMPDSVDEYIHRIGRTARVGNLGRATSFFCSETDFKIAPALVKALNSAGREVPDYLVAAAESEGGGRGGGGASNTAVADDGDDEWA